MTLMKSLLLGSAATLVVVAGAQAADLPTKKGAPAAEYVKVCKIDGMAGFVIPGSDTCLKITGYLTAQVTAGTLDKGYTFTGGSQLHYTLDPTSNRDQIGYTTRGELEFITKTNTAYGVLTADIDTQFNYGTGFDNTGTGVTLNHGFLNWAGITAGKANSFFSAFGGGPGWANDFSPDRQGFNQPGLLAYTATFGGGFSATVSLEDPAGTPGASNPGGTPSTGGSLLTFSGNSTVLGQRAPDIVAAVDLAQGWGTAHLAGVAHYVDQLSTLDGTTESTWGWAVDGGLKFNLPTLGAGDNIQLQGQWTRNAIWYSGANEGMWGENGAVNGNGIAMPITDAFSNGNGTWATPETWTIGAVGEFHFGPNFSIDPEVSYLNISWSGVSTGLISKNQDSWIGGAVAHWDPVAHLDFALELLYQSTHQDTPAAYTAAGNGGLAWKANTDGLEGRFMITRDF